MLAEQIMNDLQVSLQDLERTLRFSFEKGDSVRQQ